ncbi:MAG: hypothetical protein QOK39_2836 [Acidimicrobiaceae bacterium]|nr:hypothetical protein [Acidimicrobiaceae bacterium]
MSLPASPDAPTEAVRTVQFLGVPIATYLALQEWNDALVRECGQIAALGPGHSGLPPRLVDLAGLLSERFAEESEAYRDTVAAAQSKGSEVVDLIGTWHQPTASIEAAEAYLAMMEELDGFCRTDVLLTEAPPLDVIVLRRWFVVEMRDQLRHGAMPHRFPAGAD